MHIWHQFLTKQGYRILPQGGIKLDAKQVVTQPWLTDLSNYASLSVQGVDAEKFLQGQLTCDLTKLSPQQSLSGAYCTPKGNVITNFNIYKLADDDFMLHMARDVVAVMQAAMSKYIVFSKAALHDATEDWVRIGIGGEGAHTLVQQWGEIDCQAGAQSYKPDMLISCVQIEPMLFVLYCRPDKAVEVWQQLAQQAQPVSTTQWEYAIIQAGKVYVSQAISDTYVPQMLNLQATQTIDFNKGCYTGQEVVARMQYLGKLKRCLYIGQVKSSQPINVGMSIDHPTRPNCGRITSVAAVSDTEQWFSGVINVKQAEEGGLSVQGMDSEITLVNLPYTIDPQVFERIKL